MQPELCQHSVRTERVKPHGFKGKKLNEKENHMRTRAQSYTHTHTHTKKKKKLSHETSTSAFVPCKNVYSCYVQEIAVAMGQATSTK